MDLPKDQWTESLTNLQEADDNPAEACAADPGSVANLRTLATVQEYESKRLDGFGKIGDAIVMARQSLVNAEKALARTPSDLGLVSQALASQEETAEILAHRGNQAEAVEMAQKAVARAENASAVESELDRVIRSRATAYQTLANVEMTFGNWSEAESPLSGRWMAGVKSPYPGAGSRSRPSGPR